MKLIQARKVERAKRESFFALNEHLNESLLLKDGYLVEDSGQIIGCFIIEPTKKDIYWLKQLYIAQTEARLLPALLEAILTLAKHKRAKKIYLYSHQPMVDIILSALQFHEDQSEQLSTKDNQFHRGTLWFYDVS